MALVDNLGPTSTEAAMTPMPVAAQEKFRLSLWTGFEITRFWWKNSQASLSPKWTAGWLNLAITSWNLGRLCRFYRQTQRRLGRCPVGPGDIGNGTTVFLALKLLSQGLAVVTPFASSDARVVAKVVEEIAREFPAIQNGFAAQNQVCLATGVVLNSYQVFSTTEVAALMASQPTVVPS